jgi:tryptophanyl-tRNA synthetase
MRILSGAQPSGQLHLGNYFGAIRQWIDLQEQGEGFFFIANLHALTTVRDAQTLRDASFATALDYLAMGVDPTRACLFAQHDVPEVSELNWILSTVTPMALLERATSYKDKTTKGLRPDHGLFAYPVLMAADILLYHADLVPVGKDQKQHIEMTRDIAVKFNMTYCPAFDPQTGEGGTLKLPDPYIIESTALVPGVDGDKMSKSYGNAIPMFESPKKIRKTIMSIVTDSTSLADPKDPDSCTVYALLKLFCTPEELAEQREDYLRGGVGYGHFKQRLFEHIETKFGGMWDKRAQYESHPDEVRDILADGAARARSVGRQVLASVQEACGLRG